ncbi:MAG: SRPBCC family protein [Acidimicrobiales bacterium]
MTVSSNFNLPAAEIWQLAAGGFGDTGLWAARLDSSHLRGQLGVGVEAGVGVEVGLGASRICHVGDEITEEEIIAYHPDDMSFTYTQVDPPAFVSRVTNTWRVVETGASRSRLSMDIDLDVAWWARPMTPLIRVFLKRVLAETQEELVHWAETGDQHPRKQARSASVATP